MTDFFLQSLQAQKSYNQLDLNYTFICAQLSLISYADSVTQCQFLSNYSFLNIQTLKVSNEHAILACYEHD